MADPISPAANPFLPPLQSAASEESVDVANAFASLPPDVMARATSGTSTLADKALVARLLGVSVDQLMGGAKPAATGIGARGSSFDPVNAAGATGLATPGSFGGGTAQIASALSMAPGVLTAGTVALPVVGGYVAYRGVRAAAVNSLSSLSTGATDLTNRLTGKLASSAPAATTVVAETAEKIAEAGAATAPAAATTLPQALGNLASAGTARASTFFQQTSTSVGSFLQAQTGTVGAVKQAASEAVEQTTKLATGIADKLPQATEVVTDGVKLTGNALKASVPTLKLVPKTFAELFEFAFHSPKEFLSTVSLFSKEGWTSATHSLFSAEGRKASIAAGEKLFGAAEGAEAGALASSTALKGLKFVPILGNAISLYEGIKEGVEGIGDLTAGNWTGAFCHGGAGLLALACAAPGAGNVLRVTMGVGSFALEMVGSKMDLPPPKNG